MSLELFQAALYELPLAVAATTSTDCGNRPSEEVFSIAVEVFTSLRYGLHDIFPGLGLAARRILIVVI